MAEVTGPHTETQQAQHEADTLARMAPGDTWVRRSDVHWPPPSGQDSFPSGHSGAAFAFAAVLARFYPRLRWVFWVLAAGCAVSRSLDAVHWPSDCLAGATIGYAAGWLVLHFTQGRFAPPESAGASFDATARA
jgi:membrane-associated phospholipid phosphatase